MRPSCLLLMLALAATRASAAEPFTFWFEGDISRLAGLQAIQDHPCGAVAVVKVDKLPLPGAKGRITVEKVVELDAAGKTLQRWPMPVNYTPVAVRDTQLLVELGRERFWIWPNGQFQRAGKLALPSAKPVQCKTGAEFKGSDYVQCEAFPDMGSRVPRMIAFEGVCT